MLATEGTVNWQMITTIRINTHAQC